MNSLEETPRMLSEERIIEIRKNQVGRYGMCDVTKPYSDSIAFARAIEAELLSGAGGDAKRLDWLEQAYSDGALNKKQWASFMSNVAEVGYRTAIDAALSTQEGQEGSSAIRSGTKE